MKKVLIILILFASNKITIAQTNNKSDSSISTYLHVNGYYLSNWDSVGSFVFTNIDTLGNSNWTSNQISTIERDEDGYFVKAEIPDSIYKNSKGLWCTSISYRGNESGSFDTSFPIKLRYGGVKLSDIKLILKSTPVGAETYLIPNRIWMQKFENTPLENLDSQLQKYKVNTANTDTYAYVDETVFMVVYKMNGKYKTAIHYTNSHSVEPEQTVWVSF